MKPSSPVPKRGTIHIVSASAGSGKTTRLALELERAISENGIAPDQILATTFTRKAAAELVERARQALLRLGRSDDAELFWAARIGTVNSVAGQLVSEFAFEAGISPALIVLDEEHAEEAFRQSLGQIVTRDDLADLQDLSTRFDELPWQDIVRQIADGARANRIDIALLSSACESSVCSFSELLDAPRDGDTVDAELKIALDQAIAHIRSTGDKTKKTAEILEVYERTQNQLQSSRRLTWPEWIGLSTKGAAVKSDSFCAPVRAAAGAILAHGHFQADYERAIQLCFGLAQRALTAYQRFKTERRAIDFVDQETLALELLERPEIQDALSSEISLVLVDEFQDVSPLQLGIFLALSRIAQRNVWVGDQKQAIYGFRGADPSLMEAVVADVLNGAEPETLSIGYRSRGLLVDLTNALFVPPFREAGLAASRVVLEPATRDEPVGLGPCVERWRLVGKTNAEANEALALSICHLLNDPNVSVRDRGDGTVRRARPADIAVLCRRRNTTLALAECLGSHGVEAEVARVGLVATIEGRAILAALRLWVNTDDMLARAELAKIFDPDSVDLATLLRGDDPQRWLDVECVAAVVAARNTQPLAGAVETFDAITRTLQIDDLLQRSDRLVQGRANIDVLRGHAVSFVELSIHAGSSSPAAFVAYLAALASDSANSNRQDAQALVGGVNAVNIATWHSAKGLEWPIVVLYEIDGSFSRSALGVHVEARSDCPLQLDAPLAGRTIRYWPSPFHPNTTHSPFHDRLTQHSVSLGASDQAIREEVRLLYVAFTRARDRLVFASKRELGAGMFALFARGGGIVPPEPTPPSSLGVNEDVAEVTANWAGREFTILLRQPTGGTPHSAVPTGETFQSSIPISTIHTPPEYPPARIQPSEVHSGPQVGKVLRVERLGTGFTVAGCTQPKALGQAIHAFLAADTPGLDEYDRAEMGTRLLAAWGVGAVLALTDLLEMGNRLTDWSSAHWPNLKIRREWPIEQRLPSGSIVRGVLDMLAEGKTVRAIVDHKVILDENDVNVLTIAEGYVGQLTTYALALQASESSNVSEEVEMWIHLPLSGLMVQIGQRQLAPPE